ncbi:MAG TPA: FMN-binding protein [Acidimicrobiales bacterium]
MRRTPIVIVATVAGLAGVLTFHTKSAPLTLGSLPSSSVSRGSSTLPVASGSSTGSGSSTAGAAVSSSSSTTTVPAPSTSTTSSQQISTSTTPSTTSPPSSTTTSTTIPSTTIRSTTRSATGASVNYNYGVLSVSVTAVQSKITEVRIASLDDGGNFRSQSIDQQSIPTLEQEALAAQSANIQGVSGASYTSAGFEQSLQSALGKLGIS